MSSNSLFETERVAGRPSIVPLVLLPRPVIDSALTSVYVPGPKPPVHEKWKSENCWPLSVKLPEAWRSHRRSRTRPVRSPSPHRGQTEFPLKCKTPSGSPGARVPLAVTVTLLR